MKIPEKLFVVARVVSEREFFKDATGVYDYNNPKITRSLFGFLNRYAPETASGQKLMATQYGWAYQGEVYTRGNDFWHKGVTGTWQNKVPFDNPIDLEVAPRIWDNVPLAGIKIIDTVSRYRGNKLMKVLDPRGLEFEITIKSLFGIIQDGKIENGEIVSKCVWRASKDLVVVN